MANAPTISSIYNIGEYNPAVTYRKDDIIQSPVFVGGGTEGIPKEIYYYYALRTSTGSSPFNATTRKPILYSQDWGGNTKVNRIPRPRFIWKPSYNATVDHSPRVITVAFGNGYEQRAQDGIYNGLINFSATFEMRTEKEARAIVQFLRARRGTESFGMQHLPPIYADAGFQKLFVCSSFNSTFTFFDNYTVKATFLEKNN
tara:strand:+ start:945 stop:1547 length:603 start_codon:yes stop_codon:yes gene_type:complete